MRPLVEALSVSAIVTASVTAASRLPKAYESYIATIVGFVFLGATYALVWRRSDERVEASGLTLGGLVIPGPIDVPRLLRSASRALGWALSFAAITFAPFFFGWLRVWHPQGPFTPDWKALFSDALGQLVIIALPEEAFYRGYLQSRLDDVFERRVSVLGARVGLSLVVTSLIFALGHVATIPQPARLAVFFPSLAFGWLRYRTKGIGAGVVFHAMCNLFSEALGKGFHVY